MIIIRDEEEAQLQILEKIDELCPPDLLIRRSLLKYDLQKEISRRKWKLDRNAVEEWVKRKDVPLQYFKTKAEYDSWCLKKDTIAKHMTSLFALEVEQEEIIEELEQKKEQMRLKNEELKHEILLTEIKGLPE